MNYVVFDLEWNQADTSKEEAHESLPFEIIEIGAVKLDENLKRVGTFHRIIKPVVYPELFSYTRDIVNLTDEDLAEGVPFEVACRDFLKWCGKTSEYRFCTWGTLDLTQLQRNMEWFGVENHFSRPLVYFNVQQLFSIDRQEEKEKAYSLETAVEMFMLPETGEYHSALADASYTANIMQKIDRELLKKYPAADPYRFPLTSDQEFYVRYPDHSIYMTKAYKTKEALKVAELYMPIKCSVCGRRIRRLIPWYTNNCKAYYTVGKCREDGHMKVKKVIKNPDGKHYFEIQTVRKVDSDKAMQLIKNHKR